MEEQAATYLPSIELGHDCIFCTHDLERAHVCDKIRVTRGGGAKVSECVLSPPLKLILFVVTAPLIHIIYYILS